MDVLIELLPILIPFIVIETGLKIYCIHNIFTTERRLVGLGKLGWTLIVALVSFGWVVYLVVGREE